MTIMAWLHMPGLLCGCHARTAASARDSDAEPEDDPDDDDDLTDENHDGHHDDDEEEDAAAAAGAYAAFAGATPVGAA